MANPVNRKEAILAGENVTPVTREEYFVKEAVSNGGGGGNPGYHVEIENLGTLIPQQTVTTEADADGAYADLEVTWPDDLLGAPNLLVVTFNGQTYECANTSTEMGDSYGATRFLGSWVWDTYPFNITIDGESATIATQTTGTYSVYADACTKNVTVSDDFALARGYSVNDGDVNVTGDFAAAVEHCAPTPDNPIPSYTNKDNYKILTVNSRGTELQWNSGKALPRGVSGFEAKLYYNLYTKIATISYINTQYSTVTNELENEAPSMVVNPVAPVTLSLYSSDGLELVYCIDTNRYVTKVYDNGAIATKRLYGSVTFQTT